ncbi:MAG: IclR family transcriptional regulator [Comamonas sp.]
MHSLETPVSGAAERTPRGIQSIEIGSALLVALAQSVKPLPLKELAKTADMAPGKAHPYLVSFLKVGFVSQTLQGHYELGPLALQLGLAKLQRLDPVKEAAQEIEGLAQCTGHSVALAVWGNLGPTIVRLEEPFPPIHVNLRVGTVMSLVHTAMGRLFSAYMPPKAIEQLRERDIGLYARGTAPFSAETFEQSLAEIRKHGLSRTAGAPIPGISALCAPVFDAHGHIVLGILIMGPTSELDVSWDGTVAQQLHASSQAISNRIGQIRR